MTPDGGLEQGDACGQRRVALEVGAQQNEIVGVELEREHSTLRPYGVCQPQRGLPEAAAGVDRDVAEPGASRHAGWAPVLLQLERALDAEHVALERDRKAERAQVETGDCSGLPA